MSGDGSGEAVDLDRTLERIAYRGSCAASLDTLRDLQRAFLLRVPFENLDIHLGREISLSPDRVYEKIVTRRRGGFCYECNGLFTDLLTALGFPVTVLSARMALGGAVGPEFDHMVLQVDLDAAYLVDVGNGQSCREPLCVDGSNEIASEGYAYRVGPHDAEMALYWREDGAEWTPRFLFQSGASPPDGLRGDVPLPPDVAGVDLHPATARHAGDRERSRDAD